MTNTNATSVISRCGTFSLFLSLIILFSVLPSNFIVPGVKSSRLYRFFILNVILFSILLTYIYNDDYQYPLHVFPKCIQSNLEYLTQNKNHLVIQIHHSM